MVRSIAWQILRSGSDMPLRLVTAAVREHGLDGRDAGLLRRMVGHSLRHRGALRALVRTLARGRPEADVIAHLHVGFLQIFYFDRVPDHAAVSETVGAAHQTIGKNHVRYVNAVLREALRARREGHVQDRRRDLVGTGFHLDRVLFRDPADHPFLWMEDALSIPARMAKRWVRRMGRETTEDLARLFLQEPAMSVRVLKGDREELGEELGLEAGSLKNGRHASILIAPTDAMERVAGSLALKEGRITIQGETALRAAELVGAEEGERVLDLCAAPGGKTAVIAATGAQVIAIDRDEARLELLRETVERLGVAERVQTHAMDGAGELEEGDFDAVLVDAPCSNTGVLGARPGARWRFGPSSLQSLGELQSRLLDEGAEKVRPGGRLVWSTCSLEPEENGRRVRTFLEAHPGWTLEEEQDALPGVAPLPVDGGYAARIRRPD